jgi:Xaa-Pro aminopeptidase
MKINPEMVFDKLAGSGLGGILFCTSESIISTNVRYVSNFSGSDACILITQTEAHLFTDGRYKTQAKVESGGFHVHVVQDKAEAIGRTLKRLSGTRIGIEASRVSYDFVLLLKKKIPYINFEPINKRKLEDFRALKTNEEMEIIRKASGIASDACRELIEQGVVGRRENDLAASLEGLYRRKGAEGSSFDTIVVSGIRSALPHGKPTDKVVERNEFITIDYGCKFQGYCSDETISGFSGTPDNMQRKVHEAVYEGHMRSLDAVKVGMSCKRIDAIARDTIAEKGFGRYFLHGLGHGVGMEIHESPRLSPMSTRFLEEGMVFTIEPGIYIEGFGGVRLESLVFLSSSGPEVLSRMPKELIPVK